MLTPDVPPNFTVVCNIFHLEFPGHMILCVLVRILGDGNQSVGHLNVFRFAVEEISRLERHPQKIVFKPGSQITALHGSFL